MQCGFAGETNQVAVTLLVFGEDEKVLVSAGEFAVVFGLREIQLAAQDGLDVLLLHGVEEVHSAEDVAVVSHRCRGLANLVQMRG